MNRLKRYYNQNRKKIWGLIIIVTFLFAILQLMNFFAKKQNEQAIQQAIEKQNTLEKNTNSVNTTNTQKSNNNQTDKKEIEKSIIKEFVSYCNEKELEKAYNMITNECKQQMFSDLETFEEIYYNGAFENRKKDIVIDNWSNNTYLVYFRENALSTGKFSTDNQKGDYITVVTDDEEDYKLNINSYIGYKQINKDKTDKNIKMEVLCKNMYLNYEEYTVKVTNNTNNNIILDTLENVETLYLEDSNGMHYSSYTHELSKDLLTITKGHTRELKVKFYNSYVPDRKIKNIVFSDFYNGKNKIKYTVEI